jgi:hypothetical protein
MVFGTVDVFDARDPAIDTAPVLAGEAEHAVEARVTARRGLDAAHAALLRDVHALSTVRTVHAAEASPTAGKDALLDRCATEALATRLDAN